jgi:CheY-like chemotaxis protein
MPSAAILIIDDDPLMRAIAGEMLSAEGYQIFEAENGLAGLAVLDVTPIDLVITDMLMPEMDGIESIMAIRKRGAEAPIIAVSAGARHQPAGDLLHIAESLGADATLSKPLKRTELLAVVGRLLGDHPGSATRNAG